ncbi:MAG: adenine phosphoribosyltransferase [Crocinitomicaceae bacterium]|nr:adenine phosphoribosyltransferase [Crocinitomicaceae bacterium]
MKSLEERINDLVREVPNFPKEGINFKDITPLFCNPEESKNIIKHFANQLREQNVDVIAGIESRGFLYGFPLALELNIPFVLIRKKGKLPPETISVAYDLEYGSAEIEIIKDAVKAGQNVHIHDDLLATGGTAAAAGDLIRKCGAEVQGFSFLAELTFLNGKDSLANISPNIITLLRY